MEVRSWILACYGELQDGPAVIRQLEIMRHSGEKSPAQLVEMVEKNNQYRFLWNTPEWQQFRQGLPLD